MKSGNPPAPQPSASPPVARPQPPSGRRPRRQVQQRPQLNGNVRSEDCTASTEEFHLEIQNSVCGVLTSVREMLLEDISYKVEARQYLWEYFD